MPKYLVTLLLAFLVTISAVSAVSASDPNEAIQSANAWLVLSDKGNTGGAWEQASAWFKSAPASEWEKGFLLFRNPLGAVVNRKLLSSDAATSIPGTAIPDGEYVVIRFLTDFANQKGVVETIIQQKEQDGVWRTAAYFIK